MDQDFANKFSAGILAYWIETWHNLGKSNAEKIGMRNYGELLGLLHDFGKYSSEFQKYIADAIKKGDPEFNPDDDEEFEDPARKKGKIDHSTAGTQFLFCKNGLSAQIMNNAVYRHTLEKYPLRNPHRYRGRQWITIPRG